MGGEVASLETGESHWFGLGPTLEARVSAPWVPERGSFGSGSTVTALSKRRIQWSPREPRALDIGVGRLKTKM